VATALAHWEGGVAEKDGTSSRRIAAPQLAQKAEPSDISEWQ
jgi:hypothetical protein